MNKTEFRQKLRSERDRFQHSQEKVGEWLSMDQSTYSRMELGKTNPGVNRSLEIIKILEKHGYEGIPPIRLEEIDGKTALVIKWPWNKYVLYAILVVAALMVLNEIVNIPTDIARGYRDEAAGKPADSPAMVLIAGILVTGSVLFGLFLLIKWLWSKIF